MATASPLARGVDPAYGAAFDAAHEAGVEALAHDCAIGLEEITLRGAPPMAEAREGAA